MIFAAIVLVVGVLVSWGNANVTETFNFSTFVTSLLPFLGGAFTLGVVAELILMALKIEDHLDDIIEATQKTAANTTSLLERPVAAPVAAVAVPANAAASVSAQRNSYNPPPGLAPAPVVVDNSVQVQARVPITIRTRPAADAPSAGELGVGQSIHVYGRNPDSSWLSLSSSGRTWLNAQDVVLMAGVLGNLPVIQTP
jgi:hypothetical protein